MYVILYIFSHLAVVCVLEDILHSAHMLNLSSIKHTQNPGAMSLFFAILYHVVSAIIAQ